MVKIRKKLAGYRILLCVLLLVLGLLLPLQQTHAAPLQQKSVTLGTVRASAVTDHKFKFDLATSGAIGSMAFEYCESPLFDITCVAPSGIDASGAVITSQSGQIGFNIHSNTVSNRIVITRPPALASGTVTYDFGNIINPDTPNHTTYVRISTYSNIDATGTYVDNGVTAFSIVPSLGVNVFVPPYLTFCAGVTVSLNCQSSSGLNRDLGTLLSTATSYTTTQFAGATNDNTGYSVSVLGTTMTSGNDQISRLSSPGLSSAGTQQYGINLRHNLRPNTGHDREGPGSLSPASSYGAANVFKFNSGDIISSANTATDFNRMTVSYIINISPDQPTGIYSTTMTYVAVASF